MTGTYPKYDREKVIPVPTGIYLANNSVIDQRNIIFRGVHGKDLEDLLHDVPPEAIVVTDYHGGQGNCYGTAIILKTPASIPPLDS